MQQSIAPRANNKIHFHFWNMADDFHTFFVDKGATKELLGSADVRIQFRHASGVNEVAMFSPPGLYRQELTKFCGKAFD
jgi:hypothetical protein